MTFTLVLGAAAIPLTVTFATTVTLFEALPASTTQIPAFSFPSISPALKAIGTGTDGMTTYVEEYVVSVVVEVVPIQTGSDGVFVPTTTFGASTLKSTITPGPETVSFTFAEDATHYVYHHDPEPSGNSLDQAGEDDDCIFDGKSSITCVVRFWRGSRTETHTWSYSATTFHTTIAANTKDNGAVPGTRFVKESCIACGIFAMGVLSAWVLLL